MFPFLAHKKKLYHTRCIGSVGSTTSPPREETSSAVERTSAAPSPEPRLARTWSSSSEGEVTATTSSTPSATTPARVVRGDSTRRSAANVIRNRKVIYVNLIILDAAGAVDRQVEHELGKHEIPKPLHQLSTQLAKTWATPERVAEYMAADLPLHLVEKMALRGVHAVAQTTFSYGPFLVVQVQIQSVSPTVMVEAASQDFYDEMGDLEEEAHMSPTFALRIKACLQSILRLLGRSTQRSIEDEYLPHLLHSQMTRILEEGVAAKLKQRGFHAVSKVLAEDQEARFFFDTLQRVRQAHRPFANFEESFTSMSEESKLPAATTLPPPMEGMFPLMTTAFDKKAL